MAPIANAAGGLLGAGQTADGLEANLTPTKLQGAKASLIKDRSFIITRGTFLDCALETAISSDVPGMTSCRLTRNVYSSDGKVLMLDRGSRIIGQYQGGLERGKARIFVLWNRVETPNGVIIDIDSPGTGPLGRAGHTGYIDTHFWERFGGAIMLSLIGDVGNYLVSKANNSSGDTINFGNTTETGQDAAALALEHSIDIPPTLIKNQGDHINVFVARDLDFRGVYDLEVVH
jgi:type IV secretion system protein VirB10